MKTLILLLCLLGSTLSFAEERGILCQTEPGRSLGAFSLELDNSGIDPDSGLFYIARATWGYAYSGANSMNCSASTIRTSGSEKFKCIGYVNGDWRVEVTVKLKNGKGEAEISNIGDNIYARRTEGLVLPCQIR